MLLGRLSSHGRDGENEAFFINAFPRFILGRRCLPEFHSHVELLSKNFEPQNVMAEIKMFYTSGNK